MAGLAVDEINAELVLRPIDTTDSDSSWWRHVEIYRDELFERFKEVPLIGASKTTINEKPKKKMSRQYRNITRAITAIWPEGNLQDEPVADRNTQIREWIRANIIMKNGRHADVAPITLYRYFKDLEEGTIDGF